MEGIPRRRSPWHRGRMLSRWGPTRSKRVCAGAATGGGTSAARVSSWPCSRGGRHLEALATDRVVHELLQLLRLVGAR
eukprot:9476309-Pyramimonas_sp.AAC.1